MEARASGAARHCHWRRLPPTPIMRWLREHGGPIGRFQPGDAAAGAGGAAARIIWSARCRRCSIITMLCGCGWRRVGGGAELEPGDRAALARSGRRTVLRRIDVAGLMMRRAAPALRGRRVRLRSRLAPEAGGDAAGGVVRCRGGARGPAAADDPSSCGGWGVVAHPGAGSCGGLGGDASGPVADAAAARDLVPSLGATACGAGAGSPARMAELAFWTAMLSEPSLSAG